MTGKKILIVAEVNNDIDYLQLNSIFNSFKETNYHVELSLTNDYKVDLDYIYYKDIDVFIYDVILCFKVKNITLKNKNIPIILIADTDSITKSISVFKQINKFDYIFQINNGMQYPISKFYPKQRFQTICLFAANKSDNIKSTNNNNLRIFIDINVTDIRMSPILDVISVVNRYPHISIDIKSKKIIKSFLSSNSKLISEDENINFNDYNLVIANKHTAYNAILNQIPCIVIGESGYGGIVDQNNLKSLFESGFNGRDGGYIGEASPVKLINDEIYFAFRKQKNPPVIKKRLFNLQLNELKKIINIVDFLTHSEYKKQNLLNTILILNNTYSIDLLDENKWCIFDQFSNFLFSLEKEEFSLLSKFIKPANVGNVIQKSIYKNDVDIPMGFITELLKHKILVTYEK